MISGVIHDALKSLVMNTPELGDRCYVNTFPQAPEIPVWPAIRFALISATPIADICGTDDGTTDDSRWQIDCVAKTYGGAKTLRDLVVTLMMDTDPPCVRDGEFEQYDSETKTHRVSIDYIFEPSSNADP